MTVVDDGVRPGLFEASDEMIEDAISYADPMILRALLYQLTGDPEVAAMRAAKTGPHYKDMIAVSNEADVRSLRAKSCAFLKSHRDAGAGSVEIIEERLVSSLNMATGLEFEQENMDLYLEELAFDPFCRSLEWETPPTVEQLERFAVIVVGAGMGGLTAALQLKRAGISFTVIEKNSDVGGTWFENHYPGARVDTPSRGYTNTFGVHFGYPAAFCPWPENLRYLNWVADAFELRNDIVVDTEVKSLVWNTDASLWEVTTCGPDGEETLTANAVITAVGFLNRPLIPDIEGREQFQGQIWHTARWPENFDVKGKKFAVVGTGCSGYQLIPELALEAEHVTVFQRTPQWLLPSVGYRSTFPPQITWLDRNFPLYTNFMRFRLAMGNRAFGELAEIDPDFNADPNACNAANKSLRDSCIQFLITKLEDPDLVAKMTPPHPVLSARPVNCDPDYSILDALKRDNVTLVTDGVRCMNESGVVANDGSEHDVDVVVYATGFHATDYLYPMSVTGRDGHSLEEFWADGGPRAYLGCMVPGFPNLWTIYGPNTNGGFGPASFHELVAHLALKCIGRLIVEDKQAVDIKHDVFWSYNQLLDRRNLQKVWSDPRARNYWWSDYGRTVTMCPLKPEELWPLFNNPDFQSIEIQ